MPIVDGPWKRGTLLVFQPTFKGMTDVSILSHDTGNSRLGSLTINDPPVMWLGWEQHSVPPMEMNFADAHMLVIMHQNCCWELFIPPEDSPEKYFSKYRPKMNK